MAAVDENMVTFLLADTTVKDMVGSRVYVDQVTEKATDPYIFIMQTAADDDIALGDSAGQPNRFHLSLECYGRNLSESKTLGNRVQAITNKHRGTFGDATAKGIFAANQDSNYTPLGALPGFFGVFLDAEVIL